jgi:hypothetical protein
MDHFILGWLLPRPHRFLHFLLHARNFSIQALLDWFQLFPVLLMEQATLELVHFQM